MIDDGHAVAEAFGLVHVVGGQQDGAALLPERPDDVPQLTARLRVEARRRLVEEQHLGIADERARDGEALLLSARELADPDVGLFLERHARDGFVRRDPLAIEAAKQRQRFADRELVRELGLLQRDADPLADVVVLPAPAHAEDFDLAGRRVEQSLDDFDGGRLAGAVRPQQAEALAPLDGEVQAAHRLDRRLGGVRLDEIGAADGQHPHSILIFDVVTTLTAELAEFAE